MSMQNWLSLTTRVTERSRIFFWQNTRLCSEREDEKLVLGKQAPIFVIFSKNRACQLEALVRSIVQNSIQRPEISVLWKSESKSHAKGYDLAQKLWPMIEWREQVNFRHDLIGIFQERSAESVMFCTDDGLFYRKITKLPNPNWGKVASLALRLGQESCYSHPANETYRSPKFHKEKEFLAWRWRKAKGDFRVVYSLDAHIYPRKRILDLLSKFKFNSIT